VLNKLDRLITEKHMEPSEIYLQLQQIIENANSFMAELIQGTFLKREERHNLDNSK